MAMLCEPAGVGGLAPSSLPDCLSSHRAITASAPPGHGTFVIALCSLGLSACNMGTTTASVSEGSSNDEARRHA